MLQHRHSWTSADLRAEDPDVVDDLRFTLYADLMLETATLDLEHMASELEADERLRATKDPAMKESLILQRVNEVRLRISRLFPRRAEARLALNLDKEPPADG